jgi:hypothetical protein
MDVVWKNTLTGPSIPFKGEVGGKCELTQTEQKEEKQTKASDMTEKTVITKFAKDFQLAQDMIVYHSKL